MATCVLPNGSTKHLTADDARAQDNYALRWACEHGHLHVARWLYKTFRLTADDACAHYNYALNEAIYNDHKCVVQWLCTTFGIPWPERQLRWPYWPLWPCWSCATHKSWYWQPQVAVVAGHLPRIMLVDVLRRM